MTGEKNPLPSKFGAPFWESAKKGVLAIQHCKDCGQYVHYPSALCDRCLSTNLEWSAVSGKGTVETYSTVYRAFSPDFENDLPYTVALVKLAEEVNLLTWLTGIEPDEIEIGMEVEVEFETINDTIALHRFRPVASKG